MLDHELAAALPLPRQPPFPVQDFLAIMNAHYDTANAILEAGADPNITDKAGMAALYAAVDMSSLGEVYGMPPRKVQDTLKPTDLISRLIAKGSVVDAKLTSYTKGRR